MSSPPFTNLTGYATRVGELVPDTKGGYTDADFVKDALERYSESYPCWEQADIGDGTQREWPLNASPFGGFVLGYSDLIGMRVEELSAAAPQVPPVFLLHGRAWWLDRRTVSSAPVLYLVFETAPHATDKVRVHWKRRWTVADPSTNQVPQHHHMAVVYRACAYKCAALSAYYRRSVDSVGGSDAFSAIEVADGYDRQAKSFLGDFNRVLGVGGPSPSLTVGRVVRSRTRVFRREIP